jgi:hypothetical protein
VTELRLLRLSRGWDPIQLIGRMKVLAAHDGVSLPAVYLLVRLVFLWENQRAALPTYYATLLQRIFTESGHRVSQHWNAVDYRLARGAR